MAELSFYIPGFYENASIEVIKNIRKFYPDNSIIISSDGGPDYYKVAKEHNCTFHYYPTNLGYPVMPYGYKKKEALEWMKRFYLACLCSKGSHIMCAEDDIALLKKVVIKDEYELYAHNTPNNYVPPWLLEICEKFSGRKVSKYHYGAGGGTIYNVSTIIENYNRVYNFFDVNFDEIQNYYPTIGWYDCYMTIFFFLCGKDYTYNNEIFEIKPENRNFDLGTVDSNQFSIVHLYKNFYP